MIELGKKIAFHRKKLNLTQTELGEKLNVTAQAVSKWENGLSDPDLGTLHRLSKIFGVSTDELISEEPQEEEVAAAEEAQAPQDAAEPAPAVVVPAPASSFIESTEAAEQPAEPALPKVIIGYCHRCKKPLDERDPYFHRSGGRGYSGYLLCADCDKEDRISEKRHALYEEQKSFRRSMIWGSVSAGVAAIIVFIVAFATGNYAALAALLLAVGLFTMVSQCFWGDWLVEFMFFFFHSFRMPGIIFTLDIDGIVWAILVKCLLGFLSGFLSVICAAFGVLLSLAVSIFSFPFALPIKLRRIRKCRAEYEAVQK